MSEPTTRDPSPRRTHRRRRRFVLWPLVLVSMLAGLGMAAVWAWSVVLPFYALSPGPVEGVGDLISVEDAPRDLQLDESVDDLFFLTVQLQPVNVYEYVEAEIDPRVDVVRREVVRPSELSDEEYRRVNLDLMDESKQLAVCVAVQELELEARCEGDGAQVVDVLEDTPAHEVLQPGDVIVGIEGEAIQVAPDAVTVISDQEIGDTIEIEILRDDEPITVELTLIEHVSEPGRPMMGVLLDTVSYSLDLPLELRIDSHNIGGPSAGLMYTLGVIDLLSAGDLTHGHLVAGTGTIDLEEKIGEVGGVRQKVHAARAAGADFVLVPEGNYPEAISAAGEEIEVVAVGTLDEALIFLESLAEAS